MTDPTRPKTEWAIWNDIAEYISEQTEDYLDNYRRNLLQTQPAYIEVVGEKITVESIAKRVSARYGITVCIGRGYTSIDARYQLAQRFRRSGKDSLTLLILSDHDPEGENIAETLTGSLRDEFGIGNINAVKVAITREQVRQYNLPPVMTAKTTSSRAKAYTAKHGNNVYELEALAPEVLERLLRDAIEAVVDMPLLRAELEQERLDSAQLLAIKTQVQQALADTLPD